MVKEQCMGTAASRIYLSLLFWVTGRAVQAAWRTDGEVRREFDTLPDLFSFRLSVYPSGPGLTIMKKEGTVRYIRKGEESPADLHLMIKSLSHGMSLFTFQESTALSASRGRIAIYGDLSYACSIVRVLDRVEIYLLPRAIAKQAVKRYESPPAKHRKRFMIYLRVLFSP